jgi:hypothetical protein
MNARRKEDSLDRLLEWPAERSLIGRVAGFTHPGGTFADMINTFADAGLRIETAVEPRAFRGSRPLQPIDIGVARSPVGL